MTSRQYALNNALRFHQPEYESNTWAETASANKRTRYGENFGASFLPCKYVDSLVGRRHKKRREGFDTEFFSQWIRPWAFAEIMRGKRVAQI